GRQSLWHSDTCVHVYAPAGMVELTCQFGILSAMLVDCNVDRQQTRLQSSSHTTVPAWEDCPQPAPRLASSFFSKDLPNDFAAADNERPARAIVDFGVGLIAKAVEQGCCQILRLDAGILDVGADAAGGTVNHAAPDAAAGQGD